MRLVEQHIIKRSSVYYNELQDLLHKCKNLYNKGLYVVRQYYFQYNDDNTVKYKYLNYYSLEKKLRTENDVDYRALPSSVAQQVLMMVDQNFKSFFNLLNKKGRGEYSEKVRIPKYLDKDGMFMAVFPTTADISLTIGGDPVGDNRGINFSTAGTGTKALMDNGKYKEVQARGDIENAFLDTVFHLASNQPSTLTQDQYNTIKSLFGSNPTSNIRMIKPSDSFVELVGEFLINDLMVFNDQRNDCITIYISGSNTILGTGLMDISISVYPNLSVGYIHSNSNVAASDDSEIVLVNSFKNTEEGIDFDNQLHLKMKGKGDKALMDDGTYKEIGSSGVDISSYILEGIDFKKNTTKEGFDKIKSCVINKQHMYLYFYNAVGNDEVSFYADVIAGALYGSLNLCVYDFSSSKIVNVDIKSQDYSITVNTQ